MLFLLFYSCNIFWSASYAQHKLQLKKESMFSARLQQISELPTVFCLMLAIPESQSSYCAFQPTQPSYFNFNTTSSHWTFPSLRFLTTPLSNAELWTLRMNELMLTISDLGRTCYSHWEIKLLVLICTGQGVGAGGEGERRHRTPTSTGHGGSAPIAPFYFIRSSASIHSGLSPGSPPPSEASGLYCKNITWQHMPSLVSNCFGRNEPTAALSLCVMMPQPFPSDCYSFGKCYSLWESLFTNSSSWFHQKTTTIKE